MKNFVQIRLAILQLFRPHRVPTDGRCGFNKRFSAFETLPKSEKTITTHTPAYLHISKLWALRRAIYKLAS